MPFEPPPKASLEDVAKAQILVSRIEDMGFVLKQHSTGGNPFSWILENTQVFSCGPRSYRHWQPPGVRLVSACNCTSKAVEIVCPSKTAFRGTSKDGLDADVARVFAVEAVFEYCTHLKQARERAAEARRRHALMTEEFNGDPDGWQRSPVVCFLENVQLGRCRFLQTATALHWMPPT